MKSSGVQTIQGKAFEYACLVSITNRLKSEDVLYEVEDSKPYQTAKIAFECLDDTVSKKYMQAADTAIKVIFPLEPRLIHDNKDIPIYLKISADSAAKGSEGDVRDVICLRKASLWEIGLSCKHNHEALKHPRLTEHDNSGTPLNVADFGKNWVGYSCSEEYFKEMTPIVKHIKDHEGELWREAFASKEDEVYVPALTAIKDEIERLCNEHKDVPKRMLEYFFGSKDFYKVISLERISQTKVVAFNMSGTLNSAVEGHKPINKIPVLHMPTRLIEVRFKEKNTGEISKTTLTMVFDGGWTIDMRLHNADSKVKTTGLKFDVQLQGNPHGIYQQQRSWFE